jgi:small subunit ribosomal protein S21
VAKVEVKNNNVERAISKFKRSVDNDGILQTYREKQFYEKPSARRRRAKMEGKLRVERRRKEQEIYKKPRR